MRFARITAPPWLAHALAALLLALPAGAGEVVRGRVHDVHGAAIVGAMVTFQRGEPAHTVTVFTDTSGNFRTPELGTPVRRASACAASAGATS